MPFANNLCWRFSAVVMKKCEEYCSRYFLVLPACSRVYYKTETRQELIKEGYKKGIKKERKKERKRKLTKEQDTNRYTVLLSTVKPSCSKFR